MTLVNDCITDNCSTFPKLHNFNFPFPQDNYPNLISLIDTEDMEAMAMIRLLRELGYKFMDIWYHFDSEEMARYIYDNYVIKVSRINS